MPNKADFTQKQQFSTLDLYVSEVKRLLLDKYIDQVEWIEKLVAEDMHFLECKFEEKTLPIYAAFEIYCTEDESACESVTADKRLKLVVSETVRSYLQQLVKIGLWGDCIEDVATTLIQQQLASKLETGLINSTNYK